MSAAGREFRVLGTLEVAGADGGALPLGGPKPRALLAALLIGANEPVAVDRLVEALWGATPPATALHSIEVYVSALRKALGAESIVRERSGYRLCIELDQLDAYRFQSLLHRGEDQLVQGRAERAAGTLCEALGLWRGAAFADVAYHDFARIEAERLEELRLTAIETRLEAELALGRQDGIVAELQTLVAAHPLHERFRAQLMLALYRKGRQAAALDVYRETRSAWVEELGIEPGDELRDLERKILVQDPVLVPSDRATLGFLPAQVTTLVGREREVAELSELLDDDTTRLVTLRGPGGIGKTRLAVAAAAATAPGYPDGTWFVDLSSIRDVELLLPTIAEVLGAQHEPVDRVGDKRLLLVLDNFEQLLAAAPQVSDLLVRCPNLNVLVTSRERLRLRGEHVYEVGVLPDEAAIELFTDRARSVTRTFERSATTAAICNRLEGLPLAIELAAARVAEFDEDELSSRLEWSMAVVADGPVDAPPRHASLRAAVEWSYDLLGSQEQRLLARLGVFAGGWTLEAAEAVGGATRNGIQSLVEKSLVRGDERRFTMLETIRELAAEKLASLGEADVVASRHADWCLALAEQACNEMSGPAQRAWWERLDAELGNLRAAMAWLLDRGECERAGRIAAAAMRFWSGRGHHLEGSRWCRRILEAEGPLSAGTRARVQQLAGVLDFLGSGGGPEATALLQTAHATFVEIGDRRGAARCLDHVALGLTQAGEPDTALEVGERALRELESVEDDWGAANCLGHLGVTHMHRNRFERAADMLYRCIEANSTVRDPEVEEYALLGIGLTQLKLGRLEEARRRLLESLQIGCELGDKAGVITGLEVLAAVAAEVGDADSALRFVSFAASVREESGLAVHPADDAMLQPHLTEAGVRLGEIDPSLRRNIPLTQAVELA